MKSCALNHFLEELKGPRTGKQLPDKALSPLKQVLKKDVEPETEW